MIGRKRDCRYSGVSMALLLSALLAACAVTYDPIDDYEEVEPTTIYPAPKPRLELATPEAIKGHYLVELLGCGTCHTNGALSGNPREGYYFAGSDVGIAYSDPLVFEHPGIVFPPNLTPDVETGIGGWSREQLVLMIRTGTDRHGRRQIPVMPWPAYSRISDEDANAIATYLLALPPVNHQIPSNVTLGQPTNKEFVYFGVYRNRVKPN